MVSGRHEGSKTIRYLVDNGEVAISNPIDVRMNFRVNRYPGL